MIPDTIKISGFTIPIKYTNLLQDENCTGQYNPRTKEIRIDLSCCPEQQYATFLHEVVEAIAEIYEIKPLENDHYAIVILSEALHQFMRDNHGRINPK